MIWVGVYKELEESPKMRRLAKRMGTSYAEAIGLLNLLWFWSLENADAQTGRVLDADFDDMQYIFAGKTEVPMREVVSAMVDTGWVDNRENGIFIHDWDTWQSQWSKAKERRDRAAEYMREYRSKKAVIDGQIPITPEKPEQPAPPEKKPEAGEGEKKGKPPEKTKYADFVRLTKEEHEKLVKDYGKLFTDACIQKLNIYKGANGKKYKSDYMAILNWVVRSVSEAKPSLLNESRDAMMEEGNPFAEYGGDS